MADRCYVQKRVLNMSKVCPIQLSAHCLRSCPQQGLLMQADMVHQQQNWSSIPCNARLYASIITQHILLDQHYANVSVAAFILSCSLQRSDLGHLACMQGPAVWSLRAQTDKIEYAREMRRILEATPNLALREGMAVDLCFGPNDEVTGVRTFFGLTFRCRAAVLTTGTFMNGRIWVGRQSMPSGR